MRHVSCKARLYSKPVDDIEIEMLGFKNIFLFPISIERDAHPIIDILSPPHDT